MTDQDEISKAASALGKMAKGVPKTLTEEQRQAKREIVAKAREVRMEKIKRVRAVIKPVQAPQPQPDQVRVVKGVFRKPVPSAPKPKFRTSTVWNGETGGNEPL